MNEFLVKEIKMIMPLLEQYAPSIAGALGGPLAEQVVRLLAALYEQTTSNVPAIASAMINDPKTPQKLKTIEHEFVCNQCAIVNAKA
jgi:hypothetical protein